MKTEELIQDAAMELVLHRHELKECVDVLKEIVESARADERTLMLKELPEKMKHENCFCGTPNAYCYPSGFNDCLAQVKQILAAPRSEDKQ